MEREHAEAILRNFGLSEWEITAYMILITYGPQSAVELSRLSKVARSKTYEVITRLRKKGYVMKVPPMPTKGVTQKFVAIDPKTVFPSKIYDLQQLSRYFNSLYDNPTKPGFPNINFFTSKEALKELFIRALANSKFFYIYFINLNVKTCLSYRFEHFLKGVMKKKHHFILANTAELRQFAKICKKATFLDDAEGINIIVTSQSVILDLWQSQHLFLEINSKDAVKAFSVFYKNMIDKN
ncbi:TrmB family transcriptional regulator [Candidatus Woesearchaeota archaeon]|nr:MAG: TrmB family transcriptional regulator [Candidatus Woesearchaeota archaeon]